MVQGKNILFMTIKLAKAHGRLLEGFTVGRFWCDSALIIYQSTSTESTIEISHEITVN